VREKIEGIRALGEEQGRKLRFGIGKPVEVLA